MSDNQYYEHGYNHAISKGENEEFAIYFAERYKYEMDYHERDVACYEKETEEEYNHACKESLRWAEDSLKIFKNLLHFGHSSTFAKIVANQYDEYNVEAIEEAYDLLNPEQAWEEAYNEYKTKGKSEFFCRSLANRIKNRKENFVDFKQIVDEISTYEMSYDQAIKDGKSSDLANFYAEMVSQEELNESYAYGEMLMKEQLIKELHSEDYIEQFLNYLRNDANVGYDELDKTIFLPNAQDYWHILRIYGYTDAYFIGIQNNLSTKEIKYLQSNAEYSELNDSSVNSRKVGMLKAVRKFNNRYPDNQIVKWNLP